MSPALRFTLALTVSVCGVLHAAAGGSPEAATALERASELLADRRFPKAAAAFEQANELAGGDCFECLRGLAEAWRGAYEYDRSAEACRKALELDLSREQQLVTYNDLGISLFSQAQTPTLHEYRSAERLTRTSGDTPAPTAWVERWDERRLQLFQESAAAFRQALEASGGEANIVRYSLAEALFRLDEYDLAREQIAEHLRREGEASAPAIELEYCLRMNWENREQRTPWRIGSVAPDQPVRLDGSIEPPKRLVVVTPEYTESGKRARVRGTVDVGAIIDREGKVRCPRVEKGLPFLDRAALDAVRQWRFEPARRDGEPVSVFYNLRVNFRSR